MFYYIVQHCTLSFPIELVKTEYDFTVRSVETGGSCDYVDTYPFLASSDLKCQLEDMGIGVFWL